MVQSSCQVMTWRACGAYRPASKKILARICAILAASCGSTLISVRTLVKFVSLLAIVCARMLWSWILVSRFGVIVMMFIAFAHMSASSPSILHLSAGEIVNAWLVVARLRFVGPWSMLGPGLCVQASVSPVDCFLWGCGAYLLIGLVVSVHELICLCVGWVHPGTFCPCGLLCT